MHRRCLCLYGWWWIWDATSHASNNWKSMMYVRMCVLCHQPDEVDKHCFFITSSENQLQNGDPWEWNATKHTLYCCYTSPVLVVSIKPISAQKDKARKQLPKVFISEGGSDIESGKCRFIFYRKWISNVGLPEYTSMKDNNRCSIR